MGTAYEMSEDEKRELVGEFLSESEQHIQNLNTFLLKAEEVLKAGSEVPLDNINTMFRAAHTIKGTASMLGFVTLSHLTHEMETILDRVRNKKMNLTIQIVDVLFMAFDMLNAMLEKLKTEGNDTCDVAKAVEAIKKILSENEGVVPASTPAPAEEIKKSEPQKKEAFAFDEEVQKYVGAFIEDCDQNVARFNELLVEVEKETFNKNHLDELFRISHTLKGSAGIMKFKGIESVAHKMEDKLTHLREKGQKPVAEVSAILYKGIDWIRTALGNLRKGQYHESGLEQFLEEFSESAQKKPAVQENQNTAHLSENLVGLDTLSAQEKEKVKEAQKAKNQIYHTIISIQKKVVIKSLKALLVEERLKRHGMIIKSHPKFDAIDEKVEGDLRIQYLFGTAVAEGELKSVLSIDEVDIVSITREDVMEEIIIKEQPKPSIEVKEKQQAVQAQQAAVEVTTMRVDSKKLDNLMNLAGELVITRARFAQLVNEFNSNIFQARATNQKMQEFGSTIAQVKSMIRKTNTLEGHNKTEEASKVAKMVEVMEKSFLEMSDGASIKEMGAKIYSLDEATSSLGKLSSDIQSAVMQTRMVAIEGVFTRFKRLVRDISKDLGKEVTLEIYGEETELDKKIIDSLSDPLTHMVRNSIDHGIESKQDRVKAGKPEIGKVILRAIHRGNNICIDITDDGKGLDAEKLAAKAVEKGILTKEKAAKMTEKDKLNLIFLPGFSTAEKITSVSGRGVGMDVVKKMIESLNGTVEIETEVGMGTTFVLKIPLTLAIIQALLVVVGGEVFAFPLESVSEIIKIKNKDIYSVEGNPTIKLRDHALSLVQLGRVIKIRENQEEVAGDKRVVVITDGGRMVGVQVDRLIGEDEIVIKSLPDYFSNVKGVSGASILGDGRIALILDAATIIREA